MFCRSFGSGRRAKEQKKKAPTRGAEWKSGMLSHTGLGRSPVAWEAPQVTHDYRRRPLTSSYRTGEMFTLRYHSSNRGKFG